MAVLAGCPRYMSRACPEHVPTSCWRSARLCFFQWTPCSCRPDHFKSSSFSGVAAQLIRHTSPISGNISTFHLTHVTSADGRGTRPCPGSPPMLPIHPINHPNAQLSLQQQRCPVHRRHSNATLKLARPITRLQLASPRCSSGGCPWS